VATAAQKWLIGCGAGCLVVVLVTIGLGIGGFFFVRDIVGDVRETGLARAELLRRYGHPADFCPEPDGAVPPERVEAFLRAREIMAPVRAELEETLSLLSADGRRRLLRKIDAGVGLISQVIEFDAHRSRALLEAGMGLGEYEHLYALAYYCWLGKSPADGPPFDLVSKDEHDDEHRDEFDVREDRRELILERLNGLLLAQLRNQLAALPPKSPAEFPTEFPAEPGVAAEGGEAWRERLEAEVEALESDPYRLAWIEGLPAALEVSLHPFRSQLEESYSPLCNPTEMNLFEETDVRERDR
jgi:hypothetical protein